MSVNCEMPPQTGDLEGTCWPLQQNWAVLTGLIRDLFINRK